MRKLCLSESPNASPHVSLSSSTLKASSTIHCPVYGTVYYTIYGHVYYTKYCTELYYILY